MKTALSGTPHTSQVSKLKKLSKTERKPSVPFGGILSGAERKRVFEAAAKVASKTMQIEAVGKDILPFVQQALARGERA
jgi:ribosomal protein L34E